MDLLADSQPAEGLLSRDEFRELALARDDGKCIVCGQPATEVHHIIERRLFSEPDELGGYFLSNAASLCNPCHVRAEQTLVTPAELRAAAGIRKVVVPAAVRDEGIEANELTKWADLVLADGRRSPGPLFHDQSVQRILREAGALGLYTTHVRYPRTFHVPFSPGAGTKNERVLADLSSFEGRRVVVTVKYDGENCSIYPDGFVHARSPDGNPHPSQSRLRAWAAANAWQLPASWRLSVENMQAVHAIRYGALPDYFLLLGVWNERNVMLSWDETLEWAALLGLATPSVLYDGPLIEGDEAILRSFHQPTDERGDEIEGWVMRLADSFEYRDFSRSVAKLVRAGHVPTHARHWRRGPIEENEIAPQPSVADKPVKRPAEGRVEQHSRAARQ